MRRLRILLVIAGVILLLVCLKLLRLRQTKPIPASVSQTSQSIERPSFAVQVEKPMLNRPPWEIPAAILGSRDRELSIDQTSPGAKIASVAPDRLELTADGGWDVSIETDGEGRVAPRTRIVFPIELGGRHVKLDCRAADRPVGYFRTSAPADADQLDGTFFIEVPNCKNVESGKTVAWPARPLKIRGSFAGLAEGHH
jgi:hypothetical protein